MHQQYCNMGMGRGNLYKSDGSTPLEPMHEKITFTSFLLCYLREEHNAVRKWASKKVLRQLVLQRPTAFPERVILS
jgi:hypothetical protein